VKQTLPSLPFQTGWYSFGLPGYRSCRGTYERYPYESLPPLAQEQLTGQLQWLVPLNARIDEAMQPYRLTDEQEAEQMTEWGDGLKSLVASAKHLGLSLPEAYLRLMSSVELRNRIPSCTDCSFTISQLAFCPGDREKGYVLRFLHDQQDCVIWHLYLSASGEQCVLASHVYLDQVYTNPEAFGLLTEDEAIKHTWMCAPSFEAFLYRFWMENVLFFALIKKEPLTEEQKQYLAYYGAKPEKQ
jgi:hypothetical protein